MKKGDSEVDYNKIVNKVIDMLLTNYIRESELYLKYAYNKLDFVERQKAAILNNKPLFIFRRSINKWKKQLAKLEEEIILIVAKIEEEEILVKKTVQSIK